MVTNFSKLYNADSSSHTYFNILILVSDSEKRRLHDAFRLSSSSSSTLGKGVFSTAVLGESVPTPLTEQVFSLVGGGRGVTFRELLTLLVLVTRGTREEKFKCEYNTIVDC